MLRISVTATKCVAVVGIVVARKESQPASCVATSRLCRHSSQALPLTNALAMSRVYRKMHFVVDSPKTSHKRFSLARKPERMVLGVSTAGLISRSVGNLSASLPMPA